MNAYWIYARISRFDNIIGNIYMRTKRKMTTPYQDVPIGIRVLQKCSGSSISENRVVRYGLSNKKWCFAAFSCDVFNGFWLIVGSGFRYKFFVLGLTYVAYMCYHMTRKPISVVKSVLHRNCSMVEIPSNYKLVTDASNESTWCDYPPFGKCISVINKGHCR